MCGIIGVRVKKNAPEMQALMVDVFENQKTRGTDGGGMLIKRGDELKRIRVADPTELLTIKYAHVWSRLQEGDIVLFHHRYPTQGGDGTVPESNHPFISEDGKTALIHNGIISNDDALAKKLRKAKHKFESTYKKDKRIEITDSEVILHYLDRGPIGKAMKRMRSNVRGSMAIAFVRADEECIYLYRDMNPIVYFEDRLGNQFFASEEPKFEGLKNVQPLKRETLFTVDGQGLNELAEYPMPAYTPQQKTLPYVTPNRRMWDDAGVSNGYSVDPWSSDDEEEDEDDDDETIDDEAYTGWKEE